jgi:hypothetical protein
MLKTRVSLLILLVCLKFSSVGLAFCLDGSNKKQFSTFKTKKLKHAFGNTKIFIEPDTLIIFYDSIPVDAKPTMSFDKKQTACIVTGSMIFSVIALMNRKFLFAALFAVIGVIGWVSHFFFRKKKIIQHEKPKWFIKAEKIFAGIIVLAGIIALIYIFILLSQLVSAFYALFSMLH